MRSQGVAVKASFHRDRRRSVGFTKEYEAEAQERFGVRSRHMARWNLHDGVVVRAAQVIIPNSDLATFDGKDSSEVRWLPVPGPGNATVVSIFIAEPPESINWQEFQINGDVFGIIRTPTRYTWVQSSIYSLDAATIAEIESFRNRAMAPVPDQDLPSHKPGNRIAIMGNSGIPADFEFYDLCALSQEHIP